MKLEQGDIVSHLIEMGVDMNLQDEVSRPPSGVLVTACHCLSLLCLCTHLLERYNTPALGMFSDGCDYGWSVGSLARQGG